MKLLWNLYAKSYDASTARFSAYATLIKKIYGELNLKQGLRILNAGCGTGNLEEYCAQRTECDFEWDGFDISREMLVRARNKVEDPRFNFETGNLNKSLDYDDSRFDTVISVHSIYTVKDLDLSISELVRVTKIGGKLIIVNPKPETSIGEIMAYEKNKIGSLKFYWLLIRSIPALIINLIISLLAKKKDFKFVGEDTLVTRFQEKGVKFVRSESVYADQSHFLVFRKES